MKHNWRNRIKRIVTVMLLVNLLLTRFQPIQPGGGTGARPYGEKVETENKT